MTVMGNGRSGPGTVCEWVKSGEGGLVDYFAITLDTSIIDRYNCRFNAGMLKTLEQFNGSPIKLILSDVVLREIKRHVSRNINNAKKSATNSFKEFQKIGLVGEEEKKEFDHFLKEMEESSMTDSIVDEFLERTGLEIVRSGPSVNIDFLLDKYFEGDPPFSEVGKKKAEFPDAIALISLERLASDNGRKILMVSADKDWIEYAEKSNHFDCISDLADALAKVQPINNALRYCEIVEGKFADGSQDEIVSTVYERVSNIVGELFFYPVADAPFYYEGEIWSIEVNSVEVDEFKPFVPVRANESELTVKAGFEVNLTAHGTFDFSVYDKEDGTNDGIGGTQESAEVNLEVDVLITFLGDFKSEDPEVDVDDAGVVKYINEIQFGYVEPDWLK